ncbi:MGDG synthase family glycosyltransferase [Effusibacillus dendaii]|uniref:Processive diacylglycerol beta-glucosyltransferase n=1 Tax=Effusibacillus dendaii TaxID=2743772 RepID=A0A7I8DIX2_9BACL|nr:glycosyltransferase [Effusibacillus dendaii]BCJ87781.1 processive diacylglycerol beta-glucosyltransferase [Effusibacillus dendaii]
MNDSRILILSSSYGDGHSQVSHALQAEFQEKGIASVTVVDLFGEAHPWINAWVRLAYLKSYTLAPSLYGEVYDRTKDLPYDALFFKWLRLFGKRKLQHVIHNERPDAVIHTFPIQTLAAMRDRLGFPLYLYTVITDFSLHQRWLHSGIDRFYTATDDLRQKIMDRGIPSDKIYVSGIPLRKAFTSIADPNMIYQKYGLAPAKKTILLLAGAYGVMQDLETVIETIIQIRDLQIIVVCGKNRSLLEHLRNRYAKHPFVYLFGFTDQIHELMQISTCIFTKAGGVTLAEAMAVSVPVIIFQPVPGQERDNAEYLSQKGAACIIQNISEARNKLPVLLSDTQLLSEMKAAARQLQKRNASQSVVEDILQMMERR